jgi:hypothetical protein
MSLAGSELERYQPHTGAWPSATSSLSEDSFMTVVTATICLSRSKAMTTDALPNARFPPTSSDNLVD